MTNQLSRRQMLFAAAVPFATGAVERIPHRTPSLVELAPLLATFEAEADEREERFGAIQWDENVLGVYARCEVDLAQQLLDAAGKLAAPIALSWAHKGGAWFMFVAGELHQVVHQLDSIVPSTWSKSIDRRKFVMWVKGGAE